MTSWQAAALFLAVVVGWAFGTFALAPRVIDGELSYLGAGALILAFGAVWAALALALLRWRHHD